MRSLNLLPRLNKLPGASTRRSFCAAMKDLRAGEPALVASEIVAAASIAMWGIWDRVNVPDSLAQAYEAQYPGLAADRSLFAQWQQVQADGPDAVTGFISGLKGKLAEINSVEMLESNGYSNVSIANNPNQRLWDISAVDEAGEPVRFQVKTGGEGYADAVATDMAAADHIEFLASSEIYRELAESSADFAGRMTDIGPDYVLVDGIQDGLETLSGNVGIDVADSVLPIGAFFASLRLTSTAWNTEREFTDVNRPTKNRIRVSRGLSLLVRLIFILIGGVLGSMVGSVVLPILGSILGGILGCVLGAVIGRKANEHLQLAERMSGLTGDDLFYFKNKNRIDELAMALRRRADELTA